MGDGHAQTSSVGVQALEYAVDRYTAVHLSTLAGAELNGQSKSGGSLELGKFR